LSTTVPGATVGGVVGGAACTAFLGVEEGHRERAAWVSLLQFGIRGCVGVLVRCAFVVVAVAQAGALDVVAMTSGIGRGADRDDVPGGGTVE
jgi:hypothetical protein